MPVSPGAVVPSPRLTLWRGWIGASLVLFAFSERLFWAFFRPGDQPAELGLTLLAYALIAAWALAAMRLFRAYGPERVFLIGAMVGWLAEGVVVNTAYGAADNPFPLSVSFTGLSWHALFSILVGWRIFPRLLATGSRAQCARWFGGFGALWGLWATYYPYEELELATGLGAMAAHSLFIISLLMAGFGLMQGTWRTESRADRAVFGTLSLIAFAVYALVWLPAMPIPAAILGLIFGGVLLAVIRSRDSAPSPDLWPAFGWARLGYLAGAGGVATAVFGLVTAVTRGLPTNIALYLITMPLGVLYLGRALYRLRRSEVRPAVAL